MIEQFFFFIIFIDLVLILIFFFAHFIGQLIYEFNINGLIAVDLF